jgi:acetyl-CoA carboxylase carboxyltransferase component
VTDHRRTLTDRRAALQDDPAAAEKLHAKGKLTARERIGRLLDEGSFYELQPFAALRSTDFGLGDKRTPGDGVVTGTGVINGQPVAVYAQDVTRIGGSLGEAHARKIVSLYDLALQNGFPIIALIDSGGARIQEGLYSLDGYGAIFRQAVRASGVIPQISVIVGPAAGGAAYAPALTDLVFMVAETGYMFITGPQIIRAATGEEIDFQGLGGAQVHAERSGVAHFVLQNETDCLQAVRQVLSYLPANHLAEPEYAEHDGPAANAIEGLVPEDPAKPYDVKAVVAAIADRDSFTEVQSHYARNAVVGFARLDGAPVGIVANQPKVLAGCLDIDSSDKIARFVRLCDAFHLPVVNLVDVPGYLPGVRQEHDGIIRHGAKVLYAYAAATVPKISVVLRKAYGGGYIAMASKSMAYDLVFAWPTAELAVMGAENAVDVIYAKQIKTEGESLRADKIAAYREKFLNPYQAAEQGQVDQVILPEETRDVLIRHLALLRGKRVAVQPKKHGNIPL